MNILIVADNDPDGMTGANLLAFAKAGHIIDRKFISQANWSKVLDINLSQYEAMYVIDLSLSEEFCGRCADMFGVNFRVYDHHKSASWLANKVYATYDDSGKLSACMLVAEEYYKPDDAYWKFASYVSDRDVWQWKLFRSKEINSWIGTLNLADLEVFEKAVTRLRHNESIVINDGSVICDYVLSQAKEKYRLVEEKKCHVICIDGTYIPLINLTNNISETLHDILHSSGEAVVASFFINEDFKAVVSLRSKGGIALQIAKFMGGGGHPDSAGFRTNVETLKELLV